MSLVDYASSEEDEAGVREEDREEGKRESSQLPQNESLLPRLDQQPPWNQRSESSSIECPVSSHSAESSVVKLPDASLLLDSTPLSSHVVSGYDHSSRVAAAIAECASRKREGIALASALPRSKVPRGKLPHSRNVPDTVGDLLVPPQLSGRSNIVTEDISKLFVRKQGDLSSQNEG
ncbi:uncharacterized protein LOC127786795 [Diospyros lotus]|uniref:uncharacterized protein LOC127786795 n=1 Tax=Diospyros lotus TaxID=55363 RepID=UPI00225AF6BF|nr:uncharacterized protein LOC127786795 [Diospyros lotus]